MKEYVIKKNYLYEGNDKCMMHAFNFITILHYNFIPLP